MFVFPFRWEIQSWDFAAAISSQVSFERVFCTPSLQAAVTGAVMIEHLEKEVEANMVKAQPVPREADPH